MFARLAYYLHAGASASGGILTVALMLLFGFGLTRITKLLKLPNVTAYIITGIIIGPYCLNLVPEFVADNTAFLPNVALAFIAFSTGQFFRLNALRGNGMKVLIITVLEACVASVFVFIAAFYVLKMDLAFSTVLAALASATAPASTMMTIRQTGAHGDFVNTLLQVVALDDVVGLIAYSIAISIALASSASGASFELKNIISPIFINFASIIIAALLGVFMKILLPPKRSADNRLIISVAILFGFCGISEMLGVSPLLGCMFMSTVYINITDDDKLFKQLNYFSPPILLLFFVRSGVCFELDSLTGTNGGEASLLILGIVYFVVRIAGKYAGAFIGCLITHKNKLVRNYLGLALIPQAGVAIGLAELGAMTLGGTTGSALRTVILASSVLYELVGPACAKLSLALSHSYDKTNKNLAEDKPLTDQEEDKIIVNLLIERIREIQRELPEHSQAVPVEAVNPRTMQGMINRQHLHSNNYR